MGNSARRLARIRVAVTSEQRDEFEAEARRRGIGLSTTVRNLAVERAGELRRQRQLERARRWQTARVRRLADRIEAGDVGEASQADIDAVFDRADPDYAQIKRKGAAAQA